MFRGKSTLVNDKCTRLSHVTKSLLLRYDGHLVYHYSNLRTRKQYSVNLK